MNAPRFRPLSPEEMTAEQTRVAQAIAAGPRGGVRGPFPALLRSPELADRIRHLGDYIRFESALPPALRELAILLVARFWSAHYEWHAHQQAALKLGMNPEIPDSIAQGRRPASLTPDETLIYDFFSQLLTKRDVADDTYKSAVERFGEKTVVELICTAGYYSFISLILNANRTPVPEGEKPLPALPAGT
jgi:4-carboxymuconolactone decarboxylase